jgi:hypothetical protein
MVLSNAERQARHRSKLREAAAAGYEVEVLKKQVSELELALNEVRAKTGLPEIQLTKPAKR